MITCMSGSRNGSARRVIKMTKRLVRCEFCGHEWETQSPFDAVRCQKCMKITKVEEKK